MLSPAVGLVAGLGAVLFHVLADLVTQTSLGGWAGYAQGGPRFESHFDWLVGRGGEMLADGAGAIVPLLIVAVPTLGGVISGAMVYWLAPEAEGHGTDAAIDAYHNQRGRMRARVPLVKMLASAITLGTGGSGGREGPIAQIGAGFGSCLATWLRLSDADRRIMMVSGLGAGVGAIFHAPLAGAIFSIEVLYRDPEFEAEALIPAFIATTVSFSVFSVLMFFLTGHYAFDPLFFTPAALAFDKPVLLLPLTVLAITMSLASLAYVRCFYFVQGRFSRLKAPKVFKPAIGALATGLLGLVIYLTVKSAADATAAHDSLSVMSFGYGFLQKVLAGESDLLIGVLLIVGFGKIVTTSLTIGSGGSGGVFGPSMVIGGSLGAVVGLIFHRWFGADLVAEADVVMFAILGMASFFAAAANTPVSTLIMVSELTGSYKLLLPSMWVCALAYMISSRWSLYTEQVKGRLESPAHRGDFIIDVLEGMQVQNVLSAVHRSFTKVAPDLALRDMNLLIRDTMQVCFPVIDSEGRYVGLFGLNDIRQFLYESDLADLAVAADLVTRTEPLTMSMNLSRAIGRFAASSFDELPVVSEDAPDTVVGMLRRQDLIAAYNARLLAMRQGA